MTLKQQACKDPDGFERRHPDIAAAAYAAAETHYRAMASWRRSDLRNLCRENWPEFVNTRVSDHG